MNSNQERSLSNNWTGSAMANQLLEDWIPLWQGDNVIVSGSSKILEGTWEANAFSASAAYICQNGGDILQIGYGMCQMANFIQSHSIDTHTIIIDQQKAYEHAIEWVKDKSNVTIITGSFYEMDLPKYDGVFINKTKLLHCFKNTARKRIKNEISKFTTIGSKVSWYNPINDPRNHLGIENVEYQLITTDTIPSDYTYSHSNTNYYVPKKEIT